MHRVKSVRIWSFSSPHFPAFGLNTDQKNSECGHFLRHDEHEFNNLLKEKTCFKDIHVI